MKTLAAVMVAFGRTEYHLRMTGGAVRKHIRPKECDLGRAELIRKDNFRIAAKSRAEYDSPGRAKTRIEFVDVHFTYIRWWRWRAIPRRTDPSRGRELRDAEDP